MCGNNSNNINITYIALKIFWQTPQYVMANFSILVSRRRGTLKYNINISCII